MRLPHLLDWLEVARPDIVALQEIKMVDDAFPHEEIEHLGYRALVSGQKTYNGVAPADPQQGGRPGLRHPRLRRPAAPRDGRDVGDMRVVNLYVVNGQAVGSEKYSYKLAWLARAAQLAGRRDQAPSEAGRARRFQHRPGRPRRLRPAAWGEQILCSPPEREALRAPAGRLVCTTASGCSSAEGGHYSWWDYRQAAFRRNLGLRIDLVLISEALRASATAVGIDREPRSWERPSDHAPVWVELRP